MSSTVKAAWLSVLSNSCLVIGKLVVGLMIGSVSVISEAIHSGNDLLAACIALFAVKKSSQPPDEIHNFGHGKIENISGTIEALLIFIAAAMIIKEAVNKLAHGGAVETVTWGIVVMGASAVVNLGVSAYLMKTARREGSIALQADAIHLRTDVYTSTGVLTALVLIKVTGISIIDPIAAIIVAGLIVKAAYELTMTAFVPLMDTALGRHEIKAIDEVLTRYQGQFIEYHELRTRKAGREAHIDLHLVTRPEATVSQVHALCDAIEEGIVSVIPYSKVLIHVEPGEDE